MDFCGIVRTSTSYSMAIPCSCLPSYSYRLPEPILDQLRVWPRHPNQKHRRRPRRLTSCRNRRRDFRRRMLLNTDAGAFRCRSDRKANRTLLPFRITRQSRHTGPIQRFAAMVQSPEYQAILNARHFLIGRATQRQDEAHLLVTTVDSVGQLTLFRFFFSKQKEAPYSNCWMTDAVIRVGMANSPGDSKKPAAESPTI